MPHPRNIAIPMLLLVVTSGLDLFSPNDCAAAANPAADGDPGGLWYSILAGANPWIRPGHLASKVRVTIGLKVTSVDLDPPPEAGVVTFHARTTLKWMDERLEWDKGKFEGMGVMHVDPTLIWVPDIALFNRSVLVQDVFSHEIYIQLVINLLIKMQVWNFSPLNHATYAL